MKREAVDLIIKNASELITARQDANQPKTGLDLGDLGIIENGALAISDKRIIYVAETPEVLARFKSSKQIDAGGKIVMPGFVDCHTHLVFAGSREDEFALKIKGAGYLEILKMGGGILSTVKKTREASRRELMDASLRWIKLASSYGTTAIEVKSGYGLDLKNELKILEVASSLKDNGLIELIPTFLGAHAVPPEFQNSKKGYVEEVLQMIGWISKFSLAEFCDVFVEKGVFDATEARQILEKAKAYGFKLKLHAGEFHDIGGAELGVELGAVSIDHLDHISDEAIQKMADTKTIAVLLPSVPFHLMIGHYAPARKMIEAGVPVALATDFNPGSSPTLSMQMVIALACRQMKMTAEEAINAATINASFAIDRSGVIGSLEIDKQADVVILDIPNYRCLPYYFGHNLVSLVIKKGRIVYPHTK